MSETRDHSGGDVRFPGASVRGAEAVERQVAAPVTLRAAEDADIAQLVAIERAAFSDPWDEAGFRSLLSASAVRATVAVRQARVVGYSVVLVAADEAELANLAVDAEMRQRGVGRLLLTAALDAAGAAGVRVMFLEVRESNSAARQLYRSVGFAPVARRRGYYRQPDEDALVMRWEPA